MGEHRFSLVREGRPAWLEGWSRVSDWRTPGGRLRRALNATIINCRDLSVAELAVTEAGERLTFPRRRL